MRRKRRWQTEFDALLNAEGEGEGEGEGDGEGG